MTAVLLISGLAALTTLLATGLVRRYALARDLLDHPNARASHAVPTPRGGGLAIVLAVVAGHGAGLVLGLVSPAFAASVILAGGMVAAIGFLDDHGHVPKRWRLFVHVTASAAAIAVLGPIETLPLPGGDLLLGNWGWPLTLLAAVSLVNIYNFMDGIDGLAASELVCFGAALLLLTSAAPASTLPAMLAVAGGLGFLVWNRPPARIFMGDVGSGFLGFYVGVLLLGSVHEGDATPPPLLMVLGVFVVDATVTLLTRGLTGQRVGEAHRTHAFQHLARRWGHGRVTAAVCAVNLCWLLPLAWLADRAPAWGLPLLALAWLPLVGLALAVGAGRVR